MEPELLFSKGGVSGEVGHIALPVRTITLSNYADAARNRQHSPAADDDVLVVKAGRLAHGLYNLHHAHALTLTEVVRLVARLCRAVVEHLRLRSEGVEREQVALGEIEDVQVVPDAGAVGRGVVVTEDLEPILDTAHSDLGEQRQEVARATDRVLADVARGVRTGRAAVLSVWVRKHQ